jgi:DNA-binding GntR family transcriptional regulator
MEKSRSNVVAFSAGRDAPEGKPRLTAASSFYEELRNDILMGFLEPGARLVVDQLRTRYDVGISPIREALNRLSTEGIVKREDLKGFHVMELTEQELAEIIETQVWLNEIALRKSIERGDRAWEERVVVAFYRMRKHRRSRSETHYIVNPEREALHRDFHLSLLSACGSRWMIRYCAQL